MYICRTPGFKEIRLHSLNQLSRLKSAGRGAIPKGLLRLKTRELTAAQFDLSFGRCPPDEQWLADIGSRKTGPAYKVDVAEFTLFTRLTESGQLRTGPAFSCRRFELYTKSATRTFLMHAGPRRWGSKNNAIISAVAAMPPKRAFVIMPFSPTLSEKDWAEVFENVFKPALEECGYECSRAETSRGSLIASILEGLVEADLVLADVTDRNANVFYELGVRHSLRRGTIIVSNGTEHVPSDLRGYWFLAYGLRPAEVITFKAEIKRLVREFEDKPQRSDSPVSDIWTASVDVRSGRSITTT